MNKSKYDNIEIPEELSSVVYDAIEKGINTKNGKKKICNRLITVAATIMIAFVLPLNTISSYAETMQKIPVIGELCKIFTFNEYHVEDKIKYIDVKIPQFADSGKNDLEKRVNKEIVKIINEEVENSKQIAKEYYDAFVETGGDPKEFHRVGINIDYEVKCITEKNVSFVISKSETYPSAYFSQYFYNLDMESGRNLTLKDWLGNDYKKIVAQSINNTINTWDSEKKSYLWEDLNFEELINENTNFYIDNQGNAVVVFEKYEIAAGAAGIMEFTIIEK